MYKLVELKQQYSISLHFNGDKNINGDKNTKLSKTVIYTKMWLKPQNLYKQRLQSVK